MREKTLFLIAGPNGSGKSTFGQTLIEGEVDFFNGDKIFQDYLDRNPGDTKRDAHEHAQDIFEGTIHSSIKEGKSFAYETNFADNSAMTTPRFFKAHGYKTHLVYFALSSLKDSETRVERRVALNLGHDVPKELMKDNFFLGAKKTELYHKEFDRLIVLDNKLTKEERSPKTLLEMEKDKILYIDKNIPKWFDKVFPDLSNEIKAHQAKESKRKRGFSM